MEKVKIAYIILILPILLIACNKQVETLDSIYNIEYITQTSESLDDNYKTLTEKTYVIEQFIYQQVPELNDYADYVSSQSDGAANLTIRVADKAIDIYRDGVDSEYLGKYCAVYVGESWIDHSVCWDTFYVSENCDKVLWKDTIRLKGSDFDMYTLEEWRNSLYYRILP